MTKSTIAKKTQGYGYKYTELADIHTNYLEPNGWTYCQHIEKIEGDDYIYTRVYNDKNEVIREGLGCRVVVAELSGKSNPAQEQGAGITYARRYSLLMVLGLATEDDDAQSMTREAKPKTKNAPEKIDFKDVREKIKNATSRDEVESIYKSVPGKLRNYFTDDCKNRVDELSDSIEQGEPDIAVSDND